MVKKILFDDLFLFINCVNVNVFILLIFVFLNFVWFKWMYVWIL